MSARARGRKVSQQRERQRDRKAKAVERRNARGQWGRQILAIESNRDAKLHADENAAKQRTNAYGRIRITAKYDDTCSYRRLDGNVCGNAIKKGRRCYFEPQSGHVECLECWT